MNQNTSPIKSSHVINACFILGILFFIIYPITTKLGWHGAWIDLSSSFGLMKIWFIIACLSGLLALTYFCLFASELNKTIRIVASVVSLVIAYLVAHILSGFMARDILFDKIGIFTYYLSDVVGDVRDSNFSIIFIFVAFFSFYITAMCMLYAGKRDKTKWQTNFLEDKKHAIALWLSIVFVTSAALYTVLNYHKIESFIADYRLNQNFFTNVSNNHVACTNLPANVQVYFSSTPNSNLEESAIIRYRDGTDYAYTKTSCTVKYYLK